MRNPRPRLAQLAGPGALRTTIPNTNPKEHTMSTIIRYIGLAILAAVILAGGPPAWIIAALAAAIIFNIVPDVILHRRRKVDGR